MEHMPLPTLHEPPPANGAEALRALRDYCYWYDAATLHRELGCIIARALCSPDAEGWTHLERSNALHLFQYLLRAAQALPVLLACYPGGAEGGS